MIYVLYCPLCDESFEEKKASKGSFACPLCRSKDIMLLYELDEQKNKNNDEPIFDESLILDQKI